MHADPDPCHGCSWGQETHHRGQDRTPERAERQAVADADEDEGESAEPHEVALAREEVSMLLAEQQKTVALKVRRGTEQAPVTPWCRLTNIY